MTEKWNFELKCFHIVYDRKMKHWVKMLLLSLISTFFLKIAFLYTYYISVPQPVWNWDYGVTESNCWNIYLSTNCISTNWHFLKWTILEMWGEGGNKIWWKKMLGATWVENHCIKHYKYFASIVVTVCD